MTCINLYPTTTCDAKNNKSKLNTIASYTTKKFGIEYQGCLLRFFTHRNEFKCVFRSMKLRKYAALPGAMWYFRHNSFILTDVVFPFYFTINPIGKINENTFTISSLQSATKNNLLVHTQ